MSGPLEDIHGMIAGESPVSDDLVKRMNDVRDFPANTCGASRHAAMIAEALCKGDEYPMLSDEKEYCGESIAATVAALWECRTKLEKAEKAADRIEALETENARLRQLVVSAVNRMNRSAAIIMRDLDDPRILRGALETKGGENE